MRNLPFQLEIVRKRVKYLRLKIKGRSTVEVVLPWFVSKKKGLEFVEEKKNWILKNLKKKKQKIIDSFLFRGVSYQLELVADSQTEKISFVGETVSINARSEEEAKKYFQQFIAAEAKKILPAELKELSAKTGLSYNKLTLRSQRTRWGSCSGKKNISLNTALMRLKKELREYVLLHELCHTRQMNHGQKFWKLLEEFCPEYRHLRKQLKEYELTVF